MTAGLDAPLDPRAFFQFGHQKDACRDKHDEDDQDNKVLTPDFLVVVAVLRILARWKHSTHITDKKENRTVLCAVFLEGLTGKSKIGKFLKQ